MRISSITAEARWSSSASSSAREQPPMLLERPLTSETPALELAVKKGTQSRDRLLVLQRGGRVCWRTTAVGSCPPRISAATCCCLALAARPPAPPPPSPAPAPRDAACWTFTGSSLRSTTCRRRSTLRPEAPRPRRRGCRSAPPRVLAERAVQRTQRQAGNDPPELAGLDARQHSVLRGALAALPPSSWRGRARRLDLVPPEQPGRPGVAGGRRARSRRQDLQRGQATAPPRPEASASSCDSCGTGPGKGRTAGCDRSSPISRFSAASSRR